MTSQHAAGAVREKRLADLQAVIEDRAKIAGAVAMAILELAEQVKQFHLQMPQLTGAGNEEMIAAYPRYADGDKAGAQGCAYVAVFAGASGPMSPPALAGG